MQRFFFEICFNMKKNQVNDFFFQTFLVKVDCFICKFMEFFFNLHSNLLLQSTVFFSITEIKNSYQSQLHEKLQNKNGRGNSALFLWSILYLEYLKRRGFEFISYFQRQFFINVGLSLTLFYVKFAYIYTHTRT